MQKEKCAALCYLSGAPESRFLFWHGLQPQTGATAATRSHAALFLKTQPHRFREPRMGMQSTASWPRRRQGDGRDGSSLSFCSLLHVSAPGRRER